jgi:hypothetical protein
MKNFAMLLFISLFQLSTFAQKDLPMLRKEYPLANRDNASCTALYKKTSHIPSGDNLINGYKGAVSMMYAGCESNKAEKLRLFKEGRELLETAISNDKQNPELILLRFSIQCNAPKILGYNKEIESDKKLLLQKYDAITNKEVKANIRSFLLISEHVTAAEKEKLK